MSHGLRKNILGSALFGVLLVAALLTGSLTLAESAEKAAETTFRVTLTVEIPGESASVYSFLATEGGGGSIDGSLTRLVRNPDSAAGTASATNGQQGDGAEKTASRIRLSDSVECSLDLEQRIGGLLSLRGRLNLGFYGRLSPDDPRQVSPPSQSIRQGFHLSIRPGKTVELLKTDSERTGSVSVTIRVDPVPD